MCKRATHSHQISKHASTPMPCVRKLQHLEQLQLLVQAFPFRLFVKEAVKNVTGSPSPDTTDYISLRLWIAWPYLTSTMLFTPSLCVLKKAPGLISTFNYRVISSGGKSDFIPAYSTVCLLSLPYLFIPTTTFSCSFQFFYITKRNNLFFVLFF